MEHTRLKWTRRVDTRLMQRESVTYNSTFFAGPLQFELSKFHCSVQGVG